MVQEDAPRVQTHTETVHLRLMAGERDRKSNFCSAQEMCYHKIRLWWDCYGIGMGCYGVAMGSYGGANGFLWVAMGLL